MVAANIVVIEGDGIGPEVTREAKKILDLVAAEKGHTFNFSYHLMGGAAIDATGQPLPASTLDACKKANAILFGAIGGPKWDKAPARPEQGLLALRKGLGLFANLRPVSILSPQLASISPLKKELLNGIDMVFVRELTGGIYFGNRQEATNGKAFDVMEYTESEIIRITRVAANIARQRQKKIVQVDKANVLATSRLWRQVTERVVKEEFPDVKLTHMYVDAASMELIRRPSEFDVVLTENLFGDILTDEASMIPGSLGLSPSASLNEEGLGLYEPIHGSAPDITGKGIANPIAAILSAAMLLRHSLKLPSEADAIESAVRLALEEGARTKDITRDSNVVLTTTEMTDAIIKHLKMILQRKVRAMTLAEKILCDHAIGLEKPEVSPGQMICVKVDWTLASELTWVGMEKTYSEMARPQIWQKDRFWLAIDHTVDPRINHLPKPKALIDVTSNFAKEAGVVDFYGPNETILHTDFYRFRVQPGMLICGADSHSPSAGCLGAFAVGLGAADVVMPLVTGETWFKVPETIKIVYQGEPKFGIGGKDIILYTMGKLKRNTVAHERAVEYSGNIKKLSCDARFAISNMTAEFGGIAGIFEADDVTASFVAKRPDVKHKTGGKFFRADPDAKYAAVYEIDLTGLDSLIALYPSPDNVVPVQQVVGKALDGVFIGACTTAEEDLILAALVLEQALKAGLKPNGKGKRRVTPGSLTIVAKLRKLGLIEIYEKAGFEVGAPSCSYCLGVGADKAGEGEVWLSSQNRNFPHRMGKNSIANLASAATVAASSFNMQIANPRPYLDAIDKKRYEDMLEIWLVPGEKYEIIEPSPQLADSNDALQSALSGDDNLSYDEVIIGKAQVFGDNVDTDAIIPAEFMPGKDNLDLGTHCFEYVRPEFREKVKQGFTIVIGGIGFGCGSSREEAPRALLGAGVKCVISKSYAFIYARNQSNMALLGITLENERFYQLATEGAEITVDVPKRKIIIVGGESFDFSLSLIEERLLAGGGVTAMYNKYKSELFRKAMTPRKRIGGEVAGGGCGDSNNDVNW